MVAPTGSSDELRPGDRIGRYRLDSLLGEGGAGVVFLATREDDGGVVAIKILRSAIARDPVVIRRFEHEIRAATRLRHPNLVPMIEAADVDGRRYIVSRYLAGGSLAARLAEHGPYDPAPAVRLIDEVARGLGALHDEGIIHRDVKPANVLLESDGAAALGDLGLARGQGDTRLTRPGQLLGTMDYVAPELIRGEPATVASDVYALGCVAYAVLVGEPPFAGRSPMRAAFAHLEDEPLDPAERRPSIGPALGAVVLRALAKSRDKRPASATGYAAELRSALT